MEHKILMISDMHIGSRHAVMPPGVITDGDNEIRSNPLQEFLFDRWNSMLDRIKEIGGVDAIVNGSDTVDGMNFKQSGTPTWTPDVKTQCEVAAGMMTNIPARRKLYYCAYGSLYHTGQNLNSEDYIALLLRQEGYETVMGKDLAFKFGGCFFHLRHEMTVGKSIWMYKATHIAKELMLATINRDKLLAGMDDDGKGHFVALRGHTHQYVNVNHHHSSGFVIPCWKGRDDFIAKFSVESPSIGYIIGYCDEGRFDWELHVTSLEGANLIKQHDADAGW